MAALACVDRFASQLAFFPPDPPSYRVAAARNASLSISPTQRGVPLPPAGTRVATLATDHGSVIVAAHVPRAGARRALIFSHGNAVDLAQTIPFAAALGAALGVAVVAFDYSGYGASTGTPSAANAVRDLAAVCAWAVDTLNFKPSALILYGQSIGTGPTAALAADAASSKPRWWKGGARAQLGGVILHSPLASGLRVLKPSWRLWPAWLDIFPVAAAVKRVDAPLLVLHGKRDAVVPFECGRAVAAAARAGVDDHLFLEAAGHDDIEANPKYLPRIKRFLESEARPAVG